MKQSRKSIMQDFNRAMAMLGVSIGAASIGGASIGGGASKYFGVRRIFARISPNFPEKLFCDFCL